MVSRHADQGCACALPQSDGLGRRRRRDTVAALEQLGRTDASITELAQTFHTTLTGMRKHIGVLEQPTLVTTEKVGRVRTCRLGPRRLEEETAWIER